MPFEFGPVSPARVAVIGGGVSGMGAAHLLSKSHKVTLIEAENRLGGHARTIIAGKNADQPVDTGFIVFNYANYPRLTQLFEHLDVPVVKSEMSFSVSVKGKIEYGLKDVNALLQCLPNPRAWKLFYDLTRFNMYAEAAVTDPDMTLGQLIEKLKLGATFRDYYILPFSGAIWSTKLCDMLDFPAEALMRFFRNHNLLAVYGQHQWYTVKGGSIQYVSRLANDLRARNADIRLGASVQSVRRHPNGVKIRCHGGEWEEFDEVVFACHSDQALAMLEEPSQAEQETLGVMKYQTNRAVLHSDPSVMPKRKACWSSWNYVTDKPVSDSPVGVSYWMNCLQPIPHDDPLFQSLNPSQNIREELIYEETSFDHPVFDHAALKAQSRVAAMQGKNHTWYCGAYLKNGFHEDGYSSAVDVASQLGHVPEWA